MPSASDTGTGTVTRVSPRRANALPPDKAEQLRAAVQRRNEAETAYKAAVVEALNYGSIREVAKVAGIRSATVVAYSKQARAESD